jgi:predicted O-methyltransferase YrrM
VIALNLHGSADRILAELLERGPAPPPIPPVKRQLLEYQLVALAQLASQFDREGARILEIGTGHGGSGFLLATVAPQARVLSLTVSGAERAIAARLWADRGLRNISVLVESSWEFLARSTETYDCIFLDGDHNRIARDLPWFNRLREGGLLLCHDYSPQNSRAPSAIVYAALNAMAERLGRPFDVCLVDDDQIGMAGFYRRRAECVEAPPPAPAAVPPAPRPASPPVRHTPAPRPAPLRYAPRLRRLPASEPCGVVLRKHLPVAMREASRHSLEVRIGSDWDLTWPYTVFASPSVVPWELVRVGFAYLRKGWDLAVPFMPTPTLAAALGTEADRERTRAVLHDLRVPVYDPRLVFARETAHPFLARWRAECVGGDLQLAFLRALAAVKPRLCVLPRIWLAPKSDRDAITVRRR